MLRRLAGAAFLAASAWGATAAAQSPPPDPDTYRPLLAVEQAGFRLSLPVRLAGRAERVGSFKVDRAGDTFQAGTALSPLVRVGARLDTVTPIAKLLLVSGEYEQDLPTGTWTSRTPISGEGMPDSEPIETELRKGWGRVAVGPYVNAGGGFMTSHWGMGLVANDGDHGWEPGSARFTDPRRGDLVLRGFVATGPLTDAHLVALVAVDKVRRDDVLLPGDTAHEYIASVLAGYEQPIQAGFFAVRRHQANADGSSLDVSVFDPAGRVAVDVGGAKLTLEAEGALVTGHTTLGATADVPESNVRQAGGALRAALAFARAGGVLDLVYASGDQNLHDANQTAFHADPEFETGLLLFRYVQAAQTGRGVATASDPLLAATPPDGIDRLPTRGGMSDALVLFPRAWVRPLHGVETYGGVMFAFAPAKPVDPLQTDLAGGSPRNALGGRPGSYWGTEVDLGVRYRLYVHHTELSAGVEGGVLVPGSALRDAAGDDMPPVYGGRVLLGYRL